LLVSLAILAHIVLVAAPGRATDASDRLDRFRTLAATRLTLAEVTDPARAGEAYREIFALLDDEVVENLASGDVFASPAFLQDRLDAFAEAWGGASLRIARIGRLTVGAFQVSEGAGSSSVRVYGAPRGEAQLIAAMQREGRPGLYELPPAAAGPQFLVVWEGLLTGRGTRALRFDLVRQRGDDIAIVWSTAELFPDGLMAREYRVRGGEVRIRYELHYPGWIPGCDQQTEQEDVYRLASDAGTFVRVARRQYNAWHLALHRSVAGLLEALAAGNRAALTTLVPDAQLRQKLPARLERELACDAPDGANPAAVSVAASAGDLGPWALTFHRSGGQWRLTAATPVLQ
jgi:hypothetical protein